MTDNTPTVRLVRTGHGPVDILPSQVTPLSIAQIFSVRYYIPGWSRVLVHCYILFTLQLDPLTVWLREEFGNRAFFPDSSNVKFDLPNDIVRLSISLVVEGADPAVPGTSSSAVPVATPSVSARPSFFSTGGKRQTLNVKIIQASMKRNVGGKVEFVHLSQTFVSITESTANVDYVASVVQRRWGSGYVLVTGDGLEIEDSSGTQGTLSEENTH